MLEGNIFLSLCNIFIFSIQDKLVWSGMCRISDAQKNVHFPWSRYLKCFVFSQFYLCFFSKQVKSFRVLELEICDWIKILFMHNRESKIHRIFFCYEHSSNNKAHRNVYKCALKWLSSTVFLELRAIERISIKALLNQHYL